MQDICKKYNASRFAGFLLTQLLDLYRWIWMHNVILFDGNVLLKCSKCLFLSSSHLVSIVGDFIIRLSLRCLSVLDFWNVNLELYGKLEKKSISNQTWFFFEFELDFYCLCSLQKSISKSNWFFNFLNLIFRNWKKIEWHSIFQKSSGDRQGERLLK